MSPPPECAARLGPAWPAIGYRPKPVAGYTYAEIGVNASRPPRGRGRADTDTYTRHERRTGATAAQETVVLSGHIIDSLILAKVLDTILMMGGKFDLEEVSIGKTRNEPSRARIIVRASSTTLLADILRAIQPHGASVERELDCQCKTAPADGVFPEDFYATTHLPTQVRLAGRWIDVEGIEMDLGIVVAPNKTGARAVPMGDVRRGDLVVTGRTGIRVTPLQRPQERDVFSFMESQVSAERPHGHIIGWEHTFVHQLHHLVQAILGNDTVAPLAANFRDGYTNARVCDAMLAAARTGRRIRI